MDITMLFLFFLALVFVILLLAFSESIFLALNRVPVINSKFKRQYHKECLRHAIYQFRLSKMLHFIGIQVKDFVDRVPEYQVKRHIIRCKNCPNTDICDQCLRDGKFVSDMHFCPNYKSLMSYSRIMPPVE
ncbi:MAG: hypothetical protein L0Z73_12005 [Gammaproteobacteria bacterium]|nr:hypothetical protein [Gammaproteobacteria bacterium]